ncbi:hypothetical protein [Capnocytophaga canis]|uniref:hypothetical protein n=1 Tax=Capnocytophaga canis TaxID=1848903 RepID=UPI0037D45246
MNIYFNCTISPLCENHEYSLLDFYNDICPVVTPVLEFLQIDGGNAFPTSLNKEEGYQKHDFVLEEGLFLLMDFYFEEDTLSDAMLKIELLKSLFNNLTNKTLFQPHFEYLENQDGGKVSSDILKR